MTRNTASFRLLLAILFAGSLITSTGNANPVPAVVYRLPQSNATTTTAAGNRTEVVSTVSATASPTSVLDVSGADLTNDDDSGDDELDLFGEVPVSTGTVAAVITAATEPVSDAAGTITVAWAANSLMRNSTTAKVNGSTTTTVSAATSTEPSFSIPLPLSTAGADADDEFELDSESEDDSASYMGIFRKRSIRAAHRASTTTRRVPKVTRLADDDDDEFGPVVVPTATYTPYAATVGMDYIPTTAMYAESAMVTGTSKPNYHKASATEVADDEIFETRASVTYTAPHPTATSIASDVEGNNQGSSSVPSVRVQFVDGAVTTVTGSSSSSTIDDEMMMMERPCFRLPGGEEHGGIASLATSPVLEDDFLASPLYYVTLYTEVGCKGSVAKALAEYQGTAASPLTNLRGKVLLVKSLKFHPM